MVMVSPNNIAALRSSKYFTGSLFTAIILSPVFNPIYTTSNGGMALNVAANISAIGAKVKQGAVVTLTLR
jgi:hypothetical protein